MPVLPTASAQSASADSLERAEPPLAWHKPIRRRLEELDGLRGILALQVAFYHLQASFAGPSAWLNLHAPVLVSGWFAVDVFFALSGFVMMYVYSDVFARGVTARAYGRFFVARIARLYPVHLFAMALFALALAPYVRLRPDLFGDGALYSVRGGIASLFMMHSPWIDHRSWNFPAWSISAEWHAYIVFPVAAFALARFRRIGLLLSLALGVLIPLVVYLLVLGRETYPTNGAAVLLRVLPLFLAGMAIYGLDDRLGWRFRSGWVSLAVLAALVALLNNGALAPFAVLLIPVLVLVTLNSAPMQYVLRSRAAVFLGAISYSFYMTHALVVVFVLGFWIGKLAPMLGIDGTRNDVLSWTILLAATAGSLLIGWLTFRFVEVPGRNLVLRWFGERKTQPSRQGA